ncbi:MAG: ABC transporter substrate-binding protein [Puniceicoccales bacterium]|nr:ABC transporter substrate-binding protein [Puniceicoccales bacterium]
MKLHKKLLCFAVLLFCAPCAWAREQVVPVVKIVDHVALNATAEGIGEVLAASSVGSRIESAQGNGAMALQIAQKIVSGNRPVAVAIGTVAAQSLAKCASRSPKPMAVVYSSVTDPVGAGLATLENVTGVSNFVPLRPQIELFKKLQPHLATIGVPHNPGEANSVAIIQALGPICEEMGIGLVVRPATRTAEMPQAAAELARRVDAIFVSNDNTALAALAAIVGAAELQGIPVYVSDTDALCCGALAALGPNQREIGRQTGRMVLRILNGEPPSSVPPEGVESMELAINLSVAERLGIVVDDDLIAAAAKVRR